MRRRTADARIPRTSALAHLSELRDALFPRGGVIMAGTGKRHYESAAEIVSNILDGSWVNDAPRWATRRDEDGTLLYDGQPSFSDASMAYTRAVQTAEAFISLFSEDNPLFSVSRFLKACGL